MKIIKYVLNRLNEASTWRGIILIITSLGVQMEPEKAAAYISLGLSIVGLINVFLKEVGSPDAQKPTNTADSETTKTVTK